MLTLNDIYRYIFCDHVKIDESVFPQDQKIQLRNKIENIIRNKFSPILNKTTKNAFRKLLRKLNNNSLETLLFNNSSDELDLSDVNFPSDAEIRNKFKNINSHYQYFTGSTETQKAEDNFVAFFKSCKITADFIERNNTQHDAAAYTHAYKMLVLFGRNEDKINPFVSIDKYLHIFHQQKSTLPVHDALLKDIPVNMPPVNLAHWRKMILRHGPAALILFQVATDIHQLLHRDPHTLDEAKNAASQLRYKRYDEYPELAELCYLYHVSETHYNKCLDFFEPKRKKADRLPDVLIDGAEFKFPGYFLARLPHNDPVIYVIGHLTDCCLTLGGGSEQCIYDSVTKENCGFYVLLKAHDLKNQAKSPMINGKINHANYDIIGCGYAWLGQMDSLTIDSWDNLRPEADNKVIVPLLLRLSQEVTKSGKIRRVTIGTGGKTPEAFSTLVHPDIMREGIQCPDSYKQALIYVGNNATNETKKQRYEIMHQFQQSKICSFVHGSLFEKLIDIDDESLVYLEWIRKLFLEHDSHELWPELLEDNQNNLEQLISCVKEQGPGFLELLLQIHELGLLEHDTYELILGDSAQSMLMRTALACLKEENITIKDSKLFCKMLLILKNKNDAENAATLAGRLYNARLFNYPLLEALVVHINHVKLANIVLNQLQEANLLDSDSISAVIKNLGHTPRIRTMQMLLKYSNRLNKAALLQTLNIIADDGITVREQCGKLLPLLQSELLDSEILQLFIDNENNTYDLEIILTSLQLSNLLCRDNLRHMLKVTAQDAKKLNNIRQSVCVLESLHILNLNLFNFLLDNVNIAFDITCAIVKLHNNTMCTDYYLALIFRHPENAIDIADGLKRLAKVRLIDGMTKNIMDSSAQYADHFSCGLLDIHEAAFNHYAKDIFASFIMFYSTNTFLTDRAEIVLAWAEKYMSEHNANPFILMQEQKQLRDTKGLFTSPCKDPLKVFNTFMHGNELPAALINLMNTRTNEVIKIKPA